MTTSNGIYFNQGFLRVKRNKSTKASDVSALGNLTAPHRQFSWLVVGGVTLLIGTLVALLGGRQIWAFQHWKQARAALEQGEVEGALRLLQECREIWPDDPQTSRQIARAYRLAGRLADAQRFLKIARVQGLDDETATLESQLIEAATPEFARVEAELRRHIETGHSERNDVFYALVQGYLRQGRAEEAEQIATQWMTSVPNDWRPYFYRAAARTQLSRDLLSTAFAGAKEDYERCIQLKPDHAPTRLLLGNAYLMTGHFDKALPHLEEYVRLKPDDPAGVAELARALRGLARGQEARQRIDEFLSRRGGNVAMYLIRGDLAMDDGQAPEALTWYHRAEALAPHEERVIFQMAQALRAVGRSDEAQKYEKRWQDRRDLTNKLQEAQKRAALSPKDIEAHHEVGKTALVLGQESLGLRWLAEALKLDPNHRETHRVLAEFFQQKGDRAAAEFHRRRAEARP